MEAISYVRRPLADIWFHVLKFHSSLIISPTLPPATSEISLKDRIIISQWEMALLNGIWSVPK